MDVTLVSASDGGTFNERPRVFESDDLRADPDVLSEMRRGLATADLAAPAVVLPDFHHKSDMEMPSSVVVATRNSIRPRLTSASVNCGMALIAFDMDRPSESAIHAFFEAVRTRYPHPPGWRRELTMRDVLRCADEGAEFGVDRYGLAPEALDRIEEGGRLRLEPYGGIERLRRELPRLSFQVSRLRFGTVGPSNHFVELQQVEEILEPEAAARLGVREGQMTLQYHAGGGQLTGQVGRLFVPRKKMNRPVRLEMAVAKPLAHLASARSISQVRERLGLYFGEGSQAIDRDGAEGGRLLLANRAAMNYGFAFRAATYANLVGLAERSFGIRGSALVVDSPHNSIYEEDVDGEPAVVHRHNACRALPASMMSSGTVFGDVGQALLLPGTHRTSSYLCVASEGASKSLYSACHGAGTVIDQLERAGISRPHPDHPATLRFAYSDEAPSIVPHLDDRGVEAALGILADADLVRPVARMRPMAVLN